MEKLARPRMTWAGHLETMGDEKTAKERRCQESGQTKRRREVRDSDGRTALRGTWKTKKNLDQEQK